MIRLNPKFANAYDCRAKSYTARGDLDRAIADYGEAITINPKNAWAYSNRSRMYLYTGFSQALADGNQAVELDLKDPYIALWLDIAAQRNKLASRLAPGMAQIDMTKWPGAYHPFVSRTNASGRGTRRRRQSRRQN